MSQPCGLLHLACSKRAPCLATAATDPSVGRGAASPRLWTHPSSWFQSRTTVRASQQRAPGHPCIIADDSVGPLDMQQYARSIDHGVGCGAGAVHPDMASHVTAWDSSDTQACRLRSTFPFAVQHAPQHIGRYLYQPSSHLQTPQEQRHLQSHPCMRASRCYWTLAA